MNGMPGGFSMKFASGGFPGGFHGGFTGGPNVRKASNIKQVINITLEEGVKGLKKNIQYNRNNNGNIEKIKKEIEIPEGIGSSIRMMERGMGNIKDGLEDGDLEIIVNVENHPVFKVSDNNLVILKKIKIGNSLTGIKFKVKLLNGKNINLKISGPIYNDDIRIVRGKGLKDIRSRRIGDLIIKFSVDKEYVLNKQQIKSLKSILPYETYSTCEGETIEAIDPELLHNDNDSDDGPQNVQCQQS